MSDLRIVPDRQGGVYLGGFFNHYEDEEHLYCAEQASDQDQDISIRYVSFAEIKAGHAFPKEEAEIIYKRGGALFIKLEPWSSLGADDDSFDLEKLANGEYNKLLKTFAKGLKKFGKPVFLTFGHEPQVTDKYPWGKDPEWYKRAFRYVHDYLASEGVDNVTWVWNPNVAKEGEDLFKYDPGSQYYSWIALDGYHPQGGSTFAEIFEPSLKQIAARYPKMDIMIGEFASSAIDRTAIFNEATAYVASNKYRIGAFLYFDMNEEGFPWAILNLKDKTAYAEALKKQDRLFRRTHAHGLFERHIQTADGEELERDKIEPPKASCADIEGRWYGFWQKETIDNLIQQTTDGESFLDSIAGLFRIGDPHYDNEARIKAAKAYAELSFYVDPDKEKEIQKLYEQATSHLISALNSPDPAIVYWPTIPYIRYYFEARLQLAEIYRDAGKLEESMAICAEILTDKDDEYDFTAKRFKKRGGIHNWRVRYAHDVRDEAIDGIVARTKLILADNYNLIGSPSRLAEAIRLYDDSITWSQRETSYPWATNSDLVPDFIGAGANWIKLAWKSSSLSQPRDKVLYIGALAKLGKADILVRQGKLDEAFVLYTDVLNWEMVGSEEGFLDLAFKAFIGAMNVCIAQGDFQKAIARFEEKLPWEKIDEYEDLKKALNMESLPLKTMPAKRKWELFRNRLRLVKLAPRYMSQLQTIYLLEEKK